MLWVFENDLLLEITIDFTENGIAAKMNYDTEIIRSGRKTISVEITRELRVIVRAPFNMSREEITGFLQKKSSWINSHLESMRKRKLEESERGESLRFTNEEIKVLADDALRVIPGRADHFAPLVGVEYRGITIRNQRTRWGSCSSKGNLNFNCLLMLTPPAVLDYVVVHELCHLIEMNHSPRFWSEVRRVLPGYEAQKRWLKENGGALIETMK